MTLNPRNVSLAILGIVVNFRTEAARCVVYQLTGVCTRYNNLTLRINVNHVFFPGINVFLLSMRKLGHKYIDVRMLDWQAVIQSEM